MEMSCEHNVDHHLLCLYVDLVCKGLVKYSLFLALFWSLPTPEGNV